MTSYNNGGVFNPAYHDSETLEVDKRSSRKPHHSNPYANEDLALWGERADLRNDAEHGSHRGGWQEESRRVEESIPMGFITTNSTSASWQHNVYQSSLQIDGDSHYDPSPAARPISSMSGNMTMRWRGIAMRRMSMFPNSDPAFTEEEAEDEEQNLVKELVALSTREQVRQIRGLPMSFERKKHIRRQVMAFKSSKHSQHFTGFTDCSKNISLSFRRCGYGIKSARQTLELWHGIMKEIGGKFGSSVLTYFMFLKWLLMFNIFSFLVNFGFITIPLLVHDLSPNIPSNVSFRGLELLTGAGYFNYTVMYYGGYSNETLRGLVDYNMQLAYFFTIAIYMVLCGIVLIFSMANSFKKNYALADSASNSAWQLLCSWDFSITNDKTVRQRKSNLRVQLKESLSEKSLKKRLTLSEKLQQYGIHLGCWVLSTSLAVGCGASIFYLCQYEQEAMDSGPWSLLNEAETLLVPFVVSLMNMVIPLFFSLLNKFELYSNQRRQIYALLLRNVLLRMVILGVLCYYWMNVVPGRFLCWEPMVGQALYRLVIIDFLFLMLGSFFGEFLSNVIGTQLLPRFGVPEFDVARNVLDLIYAQTLAWIGIYFSPLLPAIQILKFFILFYLKKVSLTQNCQPPRRSSRAAQMQTIFIFLLFFPFFVGALSMVAYTAWSLTPSEQCGPFHGLNNTFSVVEIWIAGLEGSSDWVVWIYENIIRSELFYFLLTLIIIVIIYVFWQLIQGRKELIGLLRQQIINEGKDKSFLLDKLQYLQKSYSEIPAGPIKQKGPSSRRSDGHSSGSQSNSNAMVQVLLARQQLEEEEQRRSLGGVSVPSDISASSAMTQALLARQRAERQNEDFYQMPEEHPSSLNALDQAMAARQRALDDERDEYWSTTDFNERNSSASAVTQAMQARLRAEEDRGDDPADLPSPTSSVMIQVMQARQRAEEEERMQWAPDPLQNPAPSGSSALIQAMLARQQAQNEYDDGY
ncbi:transmembrane channel-like protein 5 [Kryptolebias marmoratus]|uniref:Transmembrane channel-like protein n=1 Tax=Kryptolebias marmoratus TaxID=37003 RepID=A0A3Q3BQR3_KRYMA|nr:transmembrane channel-like protein 5 [Kryptolebias marmoratus]